MTEIKKKVDSEWKKKAEEEKEKLEEVKEKIEEKIEAESGPLPPPTFLGFLEGLALFHHQWLLYYGTADSKIAVAVRGE